MPLTVPGWVKASEVTGNRELESKMLTVYVLPATSGTFTGIVRQPTGADGLTETVVRRAPVLDQTDALVTPELVLFW